MKVLILAITFGFVLINVSLRRRPPFRDRLND